MKKIISIILTLIMLLPINVSFVAYAESTAPILTEIFYDSFENGTIGSVVSTGWTLSSGNSSVTHTYEADPWAPTNKLMCLYRKTYTKASPESRVNLMNNYPVDTNYKKSDIVVKFRYRFGSEVGGIRMNTRNENEALTSQLIFEPYRMGYIKASGTGWIRESVDAVADWVAVEIHFKHNGKLNIYINGNTILENGANPKFAESTTIFNYLTFDVPLDSDQTGPAIAYLDDLRIYVDVTETMTKASESLTIEEILPEGQLADSLYKNLNLPAAIDGADISETEKMLHPVEWSSSDENLIKANGEVTRLSFKKNVTLTAKIYADSKKNTFLEKNFIFSVLPRDGATDDVILEEYKKLYISEANYTTEDINKITKDLSELPTTGPEGMTIEWTTPPDSEYISNTGAITRPEFGEGDQIVTLTANLNLNGVFETKVLTYTVLQKPDPELMLSQAMEAIDYSTITDEDREKVTSNLNLPTLGLNDTVVEWVSTNTDAITTDGIVTRGTLPVEVKLTAHYNYDNDLATGSEEFIFIVLPSEAAMIENDISQIDNEGWDNLTESFDLPQMGAIWKTEYTWVSDNPSIVIKNNRAVVYCPSFEDGDQTFNLTLKVRQGKTENEICYPVTVIALVSDQALVEKAQAELTEEYIFQGTADSITDNLPIIYSYGNGINITWESLNTDVVKHNGEVIRPMFGEEPVEVTLIATIKRNYAEVTNTYTVTVLPYESENEAFRDAYDSLIFSVLSEESIDSVTENLTLPTQWKNNSTIEWVSKSKYIKIDGETGIIERPEWGTTSANAPITAAITLGSISDERTFNVKILEKKYMEYVKKLWFEDFESWSEDKMWETIGVQAWKRPNENEVTISLAADPVNETKKVLCLDRTVNQESSGYFRPQSRVACTGIAIMGIKLYCGEDASVGFEGRSTHSQLQVGIGPTGANSGENRFSTADIKLNDWNEVIVEANIEKKTYHVWINGEWVSENGKVFTKTGEPIDTSGGIKFTNFANDTVSPNITEYRITSSKGKKTYIDDIYIYDRLLYSETQLSIAEEWEREFLAKNNVKAITGDLIFPILKAENIEITYETSNSAVMDRAGRFTLEQGEADIVWTVVITDSSTSYRKSFNLHVTTGESLTDEQAAEKDLQEFIDGLKKNYMLNALKTSMVFNLEGKYGSVIKVTSSDATVITDSGVISPADTDKSAILTITSRRANAVKTDTLNITVAKKQATVTQTQPSSGGGGGGSNGPSVVVGIGTVSQSGIIVEQPKNEDLNKSTFNDVSKDHWAYLELKYMADNKIMSGTGDGNMEPDRNIKREEFIKMLVIAMGITVSSEKADFSDVDDSAWYSPYITAAKKAGLVTGYADGRIGVGENITREDMAVMISRAASLADFTSENIFSDDSSISDYAKNAVYSLREIGVINGMGNGEFAPRNQATRAETAAMLYKAIKKDLFESEILKNNIFSNSNHESIDSSLNLKEDTEGDGFDEPEEE